jgi:diaminopimelate epimerase
MPIGRIGDDFIVDTTTASDQYSPTITVLVDGRFVVTWHSYDNGTDANIRARIFNADGSASGNDFIVNSTTTGTQDDSTITALADGRFVVTWESSDNGTDDNIRARIFNADGSASGDDFLVNDTTTSNQYTPTVTTLADGRFVITWNSYDNGVDYDIRARIFNADGSAAGVDFLVNSTTANLQTTPAVTPLADGRFVIMYQSADNGTDYDIRARVFNADGSANGDDFVVNSTTTDNQIHPEATALADGRFVITYESHENDTDYDIRIRVFNADGSADGDDFIINSVTAGDQLVPQISALADGRFVITWLSGDSGDGSGSNIRARIFDPTLFYGTAADDIWRGGSFGDLISGGAGDDVLSGEGGDDWISGDAGNDTLGSGQGNSRLLGGAGNDHFFGGTGANVLDGGSGRDVADFGFSSTQSSIVHLANGNWQVSYGGIVDTLANVELARFTDRNMALRQAPASDFDASNVSDILWRRTGGVLMIWEMNNGTYSGFTALEGSVGAWSVAGVGDFNGDGTADILWRSAGTVTAWEFGAGAHTGSPVVGGAGSSWGIAGVGDFDGDGTADILWRSAGTVTAWEFGAGAHTGSTVVGGAGSGWGIAGVGDFNGDGTSDILWRDASGTVATWEMGNGLHTDSTVIADPGGTWNISGVGDFNGDGTSDILWRDARGTVATWEMTNGLYTGATSITSPGGTWDIAGFGDFNGDGTSDILWRNASGTLATWEMGDGLRTGTTSIANPGGTWSVAGVGDYNGDGTSDILWRNANGTVAVWQMQHGRMFASTGIAGPGSNWQVA